MNSIKSWKLLHWLKKIVKKYIQKTKYLFYLLNESKIHNFNYNNSYNS